MPLEATLLQYIPRVIFALFFILATPALAGNATLADALAEKSIGSPDAPVTIVEYASLTCPHCA
ncbi:MAG TPA: DsbA family protein, partial [Rhodospirillales bacterium]|nr:DsbA family protein [Rhodospirillales bacterium]